MANSTEGATEGPAAARTPDPWPPLPIAKWQDTRDTLHMWMQMVGKIRLALSPYVNHWWQVPLYVTARGLTTSRMPYGDEAVELQFDFLDHVLSVTTSRGAAKTIPLVPKSVADFYAELMAALRGLGLEPKIWTVPVEIPNPIRFEQDRTHASYDREYASRFWRVLLASDSVLQEFRGRFIGKSSPVHFFWGSMDLAVTRFSGRRAPERLGADAITREAYSHEVISAGFWPGTGDIDAVFYSYAAPEPAGFSKAAVAPEAAYYTTRLSEFLLPYEAVRTSASPRESLLSFCQSVYDAGATLGNWDRHALEHSA